MDDMYVNVDQDRHQHNKAQTDIVYLLALEHKAVF